MSSQPTIPVQCWVEELRCRMAARARNRKRFAIAALAGLAIVPPAATMALQPPVLLVWNASASAPVGLYRVRSGEPLRRGDMVVAWASEPARRLAAERHYLPSNLPLVKGIAAIAGDDICASGGQLSVNGRFAAARAGSDRAGRPMPRWSGCRRLRPGEVLLLAPHPQSFDGRYFGITRQGDIVGRADLIWAKPANGSSDG